MRELTKSIASSSWALSLFGVQRMTDLFSAGRSNDSFTLCARSLNDATDVAKSNLSHRFRRLYDLGDGAQRGMVDLASAAIRFDAAGLIKPSIDIANPLVEGFAVAVPGRDWYLDWQELRNKIDIYDLVINVERRLTVADGAPIAELVERAYALGDFHALWAVEGLGHYYAREPLQLDDNPRDILCDPDALGLPAKSLTMLNAGIGLAFAEQLLEKLSPDSAQREFEQVIGRFTHLCQNNCREGYTGCALESLGLEARTFFPRLVAPLDAAIQETGDDDLLGYFWHGAGRANYFTARNFIPCCGISWNRLVQQASHDIGRRNLVAGLAWAITLVNMHTPSVMEKLLRRRGSEILSVDPDAFKNGVSSSIVMRHDTTPGTLFVRDFCHRSCDRQFELDESWRQVIEHPCREAMKLHLVLSGQKALEQVFRYRPYGDLEQRIAH
jgi:hypothetical protein